MRVLHVREQNGKFILEVEDPEQLKEKSYLVEHKNRPVALLTPLSHSLTNVDDTQVALANKLRAQQDEIEAFKRMYPELLREYKGKVVAIYKGQVAAVGDTRNEVLKSVWERFGPVPCYIERVGEDIPRRVRIPSGWVQK